MSFFLFCRGRPAKQVKTTKERKQISTQQNTDQNV